MATRTRRRQRSGPRTSSAARVADPLQRVDVRAIRKQGGLSQRAFAERYGFPLRDLEAWEDHRAPADGFSENPAAHHR